MLSLSHIVYVLHQVTYETTLSVRYHPPNMEVLPNIDVLPVTLLLCKQAEYRLFIPETDLSFTCLIIII